MDFRKKLRKTVVESVHVVQLNPNDPFFPNEMFSEMGEEPQEIWKVTLTLRCGLLPPHVHTRLYRSKLSADEMIKRYAVGSEYDAEEEELPQFRDRDFVAAIIDAGWMPGGCNAGDEESPLAFDVLDAAGLKGMPAEVKEFIGQDRLEVLEDKYGDNSGVAAIYEYCWHNLPHSSPAFVAAAYQYHWYISNNDFAAGYLWRDLECLVYGVETAAIKNESLLAAAKRGGEARAQSARRQRSEVLQEMQRMVAAGKKPAQAADFAAKRGLGTSAVANRALWYRHNNVT